MRHVRAVTQAGRQTGEIFMSSLDLTAAIYLRLKNDCSNNRNVGKVAGALCQHEA